MVKQGECLRVTWNDFPQNSSRGHARRVRERAVVAVFRVELAARRVVVVFLAVLVRVEAVVFFAALARFVVAAFFTVVVFFAAVFEARAAAARPRPVRRVVAPPCCGFSSPSAPR